MLRFVCPLIVVENINSSRQFYEQVLGQQVKFNFGDNIIFKGDFAIHRKAHYHQLLGESTRFSIIPRTHNCELYFESDDIEDIYSQLKRNSVEFIHGLEEQSWGQWVMRFYDPDGHVIEIGEPMEAVVWRFYTQGLTIQEVCERSSMPIEFVERVIKERS